jgi:hypothetical protein
LPSASPSDRIPLRTGAFTAVLTGGSLRDIRLSGHRALDAVYAAVRDPDWTTVPGELTEYHVEVSTDTFAVSFTCRHRNDFSWHGRVAGQGGRVTFELDGRATGQFAANRIGFCLLHPIELAGRRVLARTRAGDVLGHFPEQISPHQPFEELTGLRCEVAEGAWLDIRLDGDLFEMEDHRNWTDAGWKTYCTPLRRPFPTQYRVGDQVRQAVRLAADGTGAAAPAAEPSTFTIEVTDEPVGALPAVGFSVTDGPGNGDRLRALLPRHLSTEVGLSPARSTGRESLAQAAELAAAVDARLDVALAVSPGAAFPAAADLLAEHRDLLGRVTVVDATTRTTPAGAAAGVRAALLARGVEVPVGGGTMANFAELNRMRLPADELDFVTYGISPQMHHADNDSIMDTLLAQPHTLRDARRLAGRRPVVIGPVTLHRTGDPPDPRQGTQFLAAWTVGSLAALAGAAAITYFETAGPGPGGQTPVGRVLAAVAGLAGQPVYRVDAPHRELTALATGATLLLANLRDTARSVIVIDRGRRRKIVLAPYAVASLHRVATAASGGPRH